VKSPVDDKEGTAIAQNAAGGGFGPQNPHPLSTMRTELVWEGKYDQYGKRREVDITGLAMPMQRIETIDQPPSEVAAAGQLALFEKKNKRLDDFRNRLVWGDNKLVMVTVKSRATRIDRLDRSPAAIRGGINSGISREPFPAGRRL